MSMLPLTVKGTNAMSDVITLRTQKRYPGLSECAQCNLKDPVSKRGKRQESQRRRGDGGSGGESDVMTGFEDGRVP